jgi:AraC-like DNA-binding protein
MTKELAAYTVVRGFDPEPPTRYRFDRHYLLYALQGTMRLEAAGRSWTLPPARAAWIRAGVEILFSIDRPIFCCSALFSTDHYPPPAEALTVFEMTPLLREVMKELRLYGPQSAERGPEPRALFDLAAMLAERQSLLPSKAWMPAPQSDTLRRALSRTEASLGDVQDLESVANAAGVTTRTLARRFSSELGMTWRQAQQRLRMIRAVERLAEPAIPITEIAHSLGYASSSAFNAAFRDFAGQTPTAFRQAVIAEARSPLCADRDPIHERQ